VRYLLTIIIAFSLFHTAWAVEDSTSHADCKSLLATDLNRFYENARKSGLPVLRRSDYLTQYRALAKFFKTHSVEDKNSKYDRNFDDEFWKIIKNVIKNPKQQLTPDEALKVGANPLTREVFQIALAGVMFGEVNYSYTQKLATYWQGEVHPFTIHVEKGIWTKTKRVLKALWNGPGRFLTSFALPRVNGPVDDIFHKQYRSGGVYEPTPKEWERLDEVQARDSFKQKRDFLRHHLNWARFRRWVGYTAYGLFIAAQASVANFALHNMMSEPVTTAEFLNEAQHRLRDYQVRIYNETVPFPHLAIEIGGTVYSYGQTHMTVKSSTEYLRVQEIQALLEKDNNSQPEGSWNNTLNQSGKLFSPIANNVGPRSVQMVTLNLTKEGHARLQRFFETSTAKRYRNSTFVMDCATMVKYALEDSTGVPIPPMIDASPSLMNNYLAALKTMQLKNKNGEPLVGKIQQVTSAEQGPPDQQNILLRNLFINNAEANLVIQLLPVTIPHRMYKELRYGEGGMQYWQPEVLQVMEEAGRDTVNQIESGDVKIQLDVFREATQRLSQLSPGPEKNARIARLKGDMDYFFSVQYDRNENLLQAPHASFMNLLAAGFEIEYYRGLEQTLAASLHGEPLQAPQIDYTVTLREILKGLNN